MVIHDGAQRRDDDGGEEARAEGVEEQNTEPAGEAAGSAESGEESAAEEKDDSDVALIVGRIGQVIISGGDVESDPNDGEAESITDALLSPDERIRAIERLRELDTIEAIQAAGDAGGHETGHKYLKQLVVGLGLTRRVKKNIGGRKSRTLLEFRRDILDGEEEDEAEEEEEEEDEEEAEGEEEEEVHCPIEARDRGGPDPNGWYDEGFDGRAHGDFDDDGYWEE